jgi:hypothetical protein
MLAAFELLEELSMTPVEIQRLRMGRRYRNDKTA